MDMTQHVRKPFSTDDYKRNTKAFELLQRDLARAMGCSGNHYYPVLRAEDFGIDVAVYFSKEEYEKGKYPVAYIELEMKERSACRWERGQYPFEDIHFLYRKCHLVHQNAIPFWVCYNYDGSDCVTIQMEDIHSYPIGQNASGVGDLVYTLPVSLCRFGPENIVRTMETFVKSQIPSALSVDMRTMFDYANEAFRNRIQYRHTAFIQDALTTAQRMNKPTVGLKSFL